MCVVCVCSERVAAFDCIRFLFLCVDTFEIKQHHHIQSTTHIKPAEVYFLDFSLCLASHLTCMLSFFQGKFNQESDSSLKNVVYVIIPTQQRNERNKSSIYSIYL